MSSLAEHTNTKANTANAAITIAPPMVDASALAGKKYKTVTRTNETTGEGLRVFVGLLPMIGLLWVFFFLRIYAIDMHLPYFVDELRHIERGRIVWSFSDIQTSTTPSKFLLYYLIGIFEIPKHMPGWIARTPVAMFSMVGASATYAMARFMFSRRVALFAVGLLLTLPFMLFYERLALSDPVAASLVVLVAWWSLVYAKRPTIRKAAILGVMMSFMLAAKILSAPLVMLPVLAILLFNQRTQLTLDKTLPRQLLNATRPYWPTLMVVGGIVGVVWGIIMGFYTYRAIFMPEDTSAIVDRYLYEGLRRGLGVSENEYAGEIWQLNFKRLWQILYYLWSPLLIWVAALSTPFLVLKYPRKMLYLGVSVSSMWVIVLFAAGQLSTRYMIIAGHLLTIFVAAGVFTLLETCLPKAQRHAGWLSAAILVVWMGTFSTGFYQTLASEPETLAMPDRDKYEYFENQTGYALRDVLIDLDTMPSVSNGSDVPIVYGMVRNCYFLPSHIPAHVKVQIECSRQYREWPRRDWPDSEMRYSDVEQLSRQYGQIYVIMEEFDPPMIERGRLNATLTFVKSYPRPYDGVPVSLYIATPREAVNAGLLPKP